MKCNPQEIAQKSFFLGPQAENGAWFSVLTSSIVDRWLQWRRQLLPEDGRAVSSEDHKESSFIEQQRAFLDYAFELAKRFESEIPKFSPRYMGHMFSEISLPALVGHITALLHNPNNIATESAPVGVAIEREAITMLAEMLGLPTSAVGHFTSCGSVANLEAALRARDRALAQDREPIFLVPQNKHYSWLKAAHILGLKGSQLRMLKLDSRGCTDLSALTSELSVMKSRGEIPALLVSVVGSTELGNLDAVGEIQDLLDKNGLQSTWHHVDAAYGGFLAALKDSEALSAQATKALLGIGKVDSVTVDPHKLGYVPYACGAFLCRDLDTYAMKTFESPYIQYEAGKDPGLFTIEGSRSATGAAATWLTLKAIGTGHAGYGRVIERTVRLRETFELSLQMADQRICILPGQQSNILCFTALSDKRSLSAANAWVQDFYKTHSRIGDAFFVSKTSLHKSAYAELHRSFGFKYEVEMDSDELHLIRLTLMNPFLRSKEMKIDIINAFCGEILNSIASK